MKKWTFIVDVAKCENCNNCFLACKDEHCGNDWPGVAVSQPLHGQRWMQILTQERGRFPAIDVAYLPMPCQHCDDAPCIRASSNGAVFKRPDGIVIIDPKKAKNQEALVKSCPFGAIGWNDTARVPQKCTFCAHLLDDGWKVPRCVQACPTGALAAVLLEDAVLAERIRAEGLETLEKAHGRTQPRVYYKNLYRFRDCFIAGSLATGKDAVTECVADAVVRLLKDDTVIDEKRTDAFGDFKFDRLPAESGTYRIDFPSAPVTESPIEAHLGKSQSIGTVWI